MDQESELKAAIETAPEVTMAAKLLVLMPAIDRRIKEGIRHQDIVDALNRHGGLATPLKLETFRSYLSRYRRKRRAGQVAGRDQGPAAARVDPLASSPRRPVVRNASDLKRLRQQDVDLDELSRIGKSQEGG